MDPTRETRRQTGGGSHQDRRRLPLRSNAFAAMGTGMDTAIVSPALAAFTAGLADAAATNNTTASVSTLPFQQQPPVTSLDDGHAAEYTAHSSTPPGMHLLADSEARLSVSGFSDADLELIREARHVLKESARQDMKHASELLGQ